MKRTWLLLWCCLLVVTSTPLVVGQENPPSQPQSSAQNGAAAFEAGNELMERKKFGEALARYKEALAALPDDPSVLYNTGMAAYLSKDYPTAAGAWKLLKSIDGQDWQVRAKLIQTYQALGDVAARDAERTALFELKKQGKIEELNKQVQYCREQFEAGGERVMVFELFELKGDRALKYVFSVLNDAGGGEKYRISLGSYSITNSIWLETTKPKPKEGVRLYHLDGYYKWGHATYGMYAGEPSYESVREEVVKVLEKKTEPASSTTINPAMRTPSEKQQ